MTEPPATAAPPEAEVGQEDDDEVHPVLDLLADAGYYAVFGALGLTLVGLAAMALDVRPLGDLLVAVAITVATAALAVTGLVGVLAGEVAVKVPFSRPDED